MASEGGSDPDRIINELCDEPWKHDFFQAVRRVECAFPDKPRIGTSRRLQDDPLRFGQFLSLGFATSSLEKIPEWARPPESAVRKLLVRFTGLTGPHGPLPLRMTEFIRNRARGVPDPDLLETQRLPAAEELPPGATSDQQRASRDTTLAEFMDLFHHRMISMFYRAWAVAQKTVDMDRISDRSAGKTVAAESEPAGPMADVEGEDGATFEKKSGKDIKPDRAFSEWLASLFGMGLPELDGLDSIPSWKKVAFAGHLSHPTRHPSGLEGVLADAFRLPVEVISLVGHWIAIPPGQQSWMGRHPVTGQLCPNGQMGINCVVGSRIWDRPMKFGVRLGPMTFAQFTTFLPGGSSHRLLHDWIAFYTRQQFYWEAAIILKKEEVPQIKLGQSGRLGYTTWISSVPFAYDAENYKVRGGALDPADNT